MPDARPAEPGEADPARRRPHVDRYEIVRGLGKGAWGSVYLAHDPKLAREVAVKVLHKEFFDNPKYRARFEREARAIAALRHPNIVEIFDYGSEGHSRVYIVMEYLAGPHLGLLEREHGVLPETVLLAVGHELCRALAVAHAAGVIHRDLKPENVFVVEGRLVLADFGIVKAITQANPLGAEAANPATEVIGTPGFMAPEQLRRETLGAYSDLFSVGALLYFLGSGGLAFEAASPYELAHKFATNDLTPIRQRRPVLSDELAALIHRLLAVPPGQRPGSAEEVRRALAALLARRGATDAREELAGYVANPGAYVEADRGRFIARAQEQFYLALDERGPQAAASWLEAIRRVEPETAQLLDGVLHRRLSPTRRVGRGLLVGLAVLVLSAALGLGIHQVRRSQERPTPSGRVWLAADRPTEILYKGQPVGYTPQLQHLDLQGRRVRLVLRTAGLPSLEYYLDAQTAANQLLRIDWARRQVALEARRETK